MSGVDIDPDTGYEEGVAQRPGAPFPQESNIPAPEVDMLDQPDGKFNAFGDDDDNPAAYNVEDGTLEEPKGDAEIPVDYQGAAVALTPGVDFDATEKRVGDEPAAQAEDQAKKDGIIAAPKTETKEEEKAEAPAPRRGRRPKAAPAEEKTEEKAAE